MGGGGGGGGVCQGYVLSHARVTCVMLCDVDQWVLLATLAKLTNA